MPLGTWERIEATELKKDRVKFEINISQKRQDARLNITEYCYGENWKDT